MLPASARARRTRIAVHVPVPVPVNLAKFLHPRKHRPRPDQSPRVVNPRHEAEGLFRPQPPGVRRRPHSDSPRPDGRLVPRLHGERRIRGKLLLNWSQFEFEFGRKGTSNLNLESACGTAIFNLTNFEVHAGREAATKSIVWLGKIPRAHANAKVLRTLGSRYGRFIFPTEVVK